MLKNITVYIHYIRLVMKQAFAIYVAGAMYKFFAENSKYQFAQSRTFQLSQ